MINSIRNSIMIGLEAVTVKPVHQEKGLLKIDIPKGLPNSTISIKKVCLLIVTKNVGKKMEEVLK